MSVFYLDFHPQSGLGALLLSSRQSVVLMFFQHTGSPDVIIIHILTFLFSLHFFLDLNLLNVVECGC